MDIATQPLPWNKRCQVVSVPSLSLFQSLYPLQFQIPSTLGFYCTARDRSTIKQNNTMLKMLEYFIIS